MTGIADENKAAVQGMISLVGSYTVNERDRSMLLRIDSSSYPNLDGTEQRQPSPLSGTNWAGPTQRLLPARPVISGLT